MAANVPDFIDMSINSKIKNYIDILTSIIRTLLIDIHTRHITFCWLHWYS